MSRYSSVCDVYDSLVSIHEYTEEELINNVTIYVGKNTEPLQINSKKDIIPYYPHVICSASFDNKRREAVLYITSESYVDTSERSILENCLKDTLKIYNRCKRNKTEFDVNEALEKLYWKDWNMNSMKELVNRVKEYGNKATIDGIHLKSNEYHRQLLAEIMVQNGINLADTKYERFLNEVNK